MEASERAELGRRPIPGEQPAGRPVTEDPDFEALRAEVMKDPVRDEHTDWKRVVELGTAIVGERSKDVTAATYLAQGLFETEGYAGLLDGLRLLEGLLQEHWEGAFPPVPKRRRGRANAVRWLAERAEARAQRSAPAAEEREALLACVQACTDLDKLLEERFEDLDVGMGALTRALRASAERLTAEAPAPEAPAVEPAPEAAAAPGEEADARAREAEPEAPAPAGPAGPAASPPSGTPAAAAGAPARGAGATAELEVSSQSEAQLLVFRSAAFLRRREPSGPTPYRLVRALRWGPVLAAPPAEGGRTGLVPPSSERRAALGRLRDQGDWAGLLEASEEAFREGAPLWLDLQRWSAEALDRLGGPYAAARTAVLEELAGLLRRAPELPELAFRDGTPFADEGTRAWIAEEVRGAGAEGPAAPAPAPREGGAAPAGADGEAAARAARELVRKGDLGEALRAAEEGSGWAGSPRGRFLAHLEVASALAGLGRERMAVPMLEALDETSRRHALEEWEPSLAARLLATLYRARRKLASQRGAPAEAAARAEETYGRLCRLDPGAAAALEGRS